MAHEIHWSYDGDTGPQAWGDLDPLYVMCKVGRCQSPIDIVDAVPQTLCEITFRYRPTRLNIVNNGHSIQVNCEEAGCIEVDGERFDLLQFHFHTPSEHTYAGKFSDIEMHLVHRSQQGRLAVVGVMFDEGAENAALQPIWERMPAEVCPEQRCDVVVDVRDLLPEDCVTYRYEGSLTTPPGTENVLWMMMVHPLTVSLAQVKAFAAIFPHNNRPVQPLNGRVVAVG